ncbi:hypothetical protein NBRC10512_001952 [Rhodotorula toruloides]|uniref:RHTO0S03e11628g1_1 n=2 Tax=Rhodotorula toruloides TaxID=5286 RepID=A0A061ANA9_RHOTO|nr:DUF1752 family protein [Rhodotorula toruloides NP11]EMS26120.1 DUF1752 family protein [Rhodotorula toruloides NP11]CDR38637.1 RHTO0S03e11628g1_1 [Rhodotorula toruloides]
MHTALSTHVLALAPDSLASLGQLDLDSLSELWSLFTRCKDNLQNGRRLENLSWRLWYESGGCRRDGVPLPRSAQGSPKAVEADWSDPEWEEASDTDTGASFSVDEKEEDESVPPASPPRTRASPPSTSTHKHPSPSISPRSATETDTSRGRTSTTVPPRPPLARRGVSREWGGAPVISGGSLQRMIADLQRLPEIPVPGRARSVDGATVNGLNKPPLGSRGSSAPDNLNAASLQASRAASPTPAAADLTRSSSSASTSARQRSRANSSSISRSASTPAANAPEEPHQPAPPPPPAPPNRRVPSGLAMSTMPATAARRPAAVSPSPPTPEEVIRMTPSETAMLALSNSRNRSDLSLSRRAQSTAELAASFKPASFVKGFEPSPPQARQQAQVVVPASVEARPGPGAIAPPPTPATTLASLGPSPPKSALKSPSSASSSRSTSTPAKVPPPPSAQVQRTGPGPSAFRHPPPAAGPGAGGDRAKKIFFISSPESDEEGSRSSAGGGGGRSGGSGAGMKVVVSPPSAVKKSVQVGDKGKGKEVERKGGRGEAEEVDEWASETESDEQEEEDDDSSGWGSEYSTESDIARDSARRAGARASDSTNLFAKQRTASTATLNNGANTGGPGELTRRPPGLLSQLFHPDQFIDDSDRNPSTADLMRRNHKSMSALPTLGRLQQSEKSTAGRLGANGRSKSFLKGKPEHVELESSSDEGEGYGGRGPPVAEREEEEEGSSEYEDVDADAEAKAAAAAALARRQRELEEVVAPPQTPRTTRRAMLATELSESLRRNLLWERQTRNRIMGGMPRRPTMPGEPLPQRPASSTNLAAAMQQQGPPSAPAVPPSQLQQPHQPTVTRAQTDEGGVRAPNPSPATRHSPPLSKRSPPTQPQRPHAPQHHHTQHAPRHPGTTNLPRRHTTGTGLYLQALNGGSFRRARAADTDSELSQSSDDEDDGRASPADVFGSSIGGQRVW